MAFPRKAPTVAAKPVDRRAKRLVVLVSGSGTNLQALLDEIATTGAEAYGAEIVAERLEVGAGSGDQHDEALGSP
ncbi:phosphoribosylglycinamide formyltransferase, partial [Streptomyces anthocyanicus]